MRGAGPYGSLSGALQLHRGAAGTSPGEGRCSGTHRGQARRRRSDRGARRPASTSATTRGVIRGSTRGPDGPDALGYLRAALARLPGRQHRSTTRLPTWIRYNGQVYRSTGRPAVCTSRPTSRLPADGATTLGVALLLASRTRRNGKAMQDHRAQARRRRSSPGLRAHPDCS